LKLTIKLDVTATNNINWSIYLFHISDNKTDGIQCLMFPVQSIFSITVSLHTLDSFETNESKITMNISNIFNLVLIAGLTHENTFHQFSSIRTVEQIGNDSRNWITMNEYMNIDCSHTTVIQVKLHKSPVVPYLRTVTQVRSSTTTAQITYCSVSMYNVLKFTKIFYNAQKFNLLKSIKHHLLIN
jgi:hypothetical protein